MILILVSRLETIPKIVPLFDEIQDPDLEIYYFDWKNHIEILKRILKKRERL